VTLAWLWGKSLTVVLSAARARNLGPLFGPFGMTRIHCILSGSPDSVQSLFIGAGNRAPAVFSDSTVGPHRQLKKSLEVPSEGAPNGFNSLFWPRFPREVTQ
jgi:hypothetical protein